MCVQNDQRDEGIILRYAYWGIWDPPPPPEDPPLPNRAQKVEGGVGVKV